MLRVPILHARDGMVLAQPIHHPACTSVVLLRPGAVVDGSSLRRLKEIGVPELWIHYPALDELAQIVHPSVQRACRDLVGLIGGAIDDLVLHPHARLDYPAYRRGVVGVLEQLSEHPKAAIFLSEMVGPQRPALRHAANVSMLSILMGLKLDFYLLRERQRLVGGSAKDITGLGVGAMLHDVGMLRLTDNVLARWNSTLDDTDPEWQRHVLLGFEMVRGEVEPTAATVVLHHHQKFDGTGFPRRRDLSGTDRPISGSEIHIFARIAAAADLFDRLKHPPSEDGPGHPVVRVLKTLAQPPYSAWIDPVVFRALMAIAPPYPPGSLVTLTGGRRAVVARCSYEHPCQPIVYLIENLDARISRNSKVRPSQEIDLRLEKDVQIIEIDGFDVSQDNFWPGFKGEFELLNFAAAAENRQVSSPAN